MQVLPDGERGFVWVMGCRSCHYWFETGGGLQAVGLLVRDPTLEVCNAGD